MKKTLFILSRNKMKLMMLGISIILILLIVTWCIRGENKIQLDKYFSKSLIVTALKTNKGIIEKKPKKYMVYLNWGRFWQKLGKYNKAEKMFKKAMRINPRYHPIYEGLAACYKAQGKDKLAEKILLVNKVQYTYPKYDIKQTLGMLSNKRAEYLRPEKVMKLLKLKDGMVIGDIGCGPGYFTFRFARVVGPNGRVYAIDVQEMAIKLLRKKISDKTINPFDNIISFCNKTDGTLLPPSTLDLAFLCEVHFHNFPELMDENIRMIKSCYNSVKPGGRLVVVENKNKGYKTTGEIISKHYENAGFVREMLIEDFSKRALFISFVKPK